MKLHLLQNRHLSEPEIDIRYPHMDEKIGRIIHYINQHEHVIEGIADGKHYQIPLPEILYFEIVDKKTFFYTKTRIYESPKSLLALQTECEKTNLLRISKNVLMNLNFLVSVKPYPNHRLLIELENNEQLLVSRKYIPGFLKKMGGDQNE